MSGPATGVAREGSVGSRPQAPAGARAAASPSGSEVAAAATAPGSTDQVSRGSTGDEVRDLAGEGLQHAADEPTDAARDGAGKGATDEPGDGATDGTTDEGQRRVRDDDADEDTDEDTDPTDPGREPPGSTTLIPPAPTDLRTCPNCDAPNSARRNLCGRCGADLSTGEVPDTRGHVIAPGSAGVGAADRHGGSDRRGAPGELDADRRRTGRIVALVVAVGVLLGALIGGLIALDAGPFGDGADDAAVPEAPPFDPARYAGEPEALTVTAIGATTTHEPLGDERYDAARMVDRDLATAWNNDGARNADGVGEVIAVEFEQPVWVDRVVLANGSQDADVSFLGNARVERARFRFDGGVVYEVTFLDRQDLQAVELPEPVLTTGALVDVLSAFPGDTYEDLAITELRFSGWVADAADAAIAEDRAGTTDGDA